MAFSPGSLAIFCNKFSGTVGFSSACAVFNKNSLTFVITGSQTLSGLQRGQLPPGPFAVFLARGLVSGFLLRLVVGFLLRLLALLEFKLAIDASLRR